MFQWGSANGPSNFSPESKCSARYDRPRPTTPDNTSQAASPNTAHSKRAFTNPNVDAPGHYIGTQLNDSDTTAIRMTANCEHLAIRSGGGRPSGYVL